MIEKIRRFIKSIFVFKNWIMYSLDIIKKNNYLILKTRKGINYKVRKNTADKGIILEIFFDKVYTPDGFEIEENDLVIDIGAHIGVFSLFASTYTKNKIFSFEPLPENFDLLKENVEFNKKNNIRIFNLGVCGKKGKRYIFYDDSNTGGHSLFKKSSKKFLIKCITLDEIFDNFKIERCDFLKIDCEGCEYEIIFYSKKNTLKKISKISMEIHQVRKNKIIKLEKVLKSVGFEVIEKNKMLYAKRFNF
ncbi:MAG: FkbM family methyltransferase [Candidatus Woesearchaeota archaeon]